MVGLSGFRCLLLILFSPQDDGHSPWLKFAKGVISGAYRGQETFLGMVEAIVKKTERILAGKSLRNFHYTTAFGQLCDVLATISPHSYRTFRAHFGGPAFRTLR